MPAASRELLSEGPFELEPRPLPPLPLLSAVHELVWVGRTWIVVGALGLAAGLVRGSPDQFTPLEAAGTVLLFGATVSGALAGVLLGRRSSPASLYAQIFDRAPGPPVRARREGYRETASRAIFAALGLVVAMTVVATIGLAATLVLMGKPRDEVLDHLAAGAELVAAGWTLVCGASALRVATWIGRWERRRRKVVLCRALLSGSMRPVYYVDDVVAPTEASRDRC